MSFFTVLMAVFLAVNFAGEAHAYLDPGSGSMLLQLLLGGVAGILLAIKIFWRRILSMFGIKNDRVGSSEDSKH